MQWKKNWGQLGSNFLSHNSIVIRHQKYVPPCVQGGIWKKGSVLPSPKGFPLVPHLPAKPSKKHYGRRKTAGSFPDPEMYVPTMEGTAP